MTQSAVDDLTSAIYDAALDALHWPAVLARLKTCFRTEAETFYVLDFGTRRLTQAHLAGIEPRWMTCFDALYFAPDNPWNVHSEALHRLGMVRTNERLDAHTRETNVLYRSGYYQEWMRPQGFRYSLGNTLTTERSGVTLAMPLPEGRASHTDTLVLPRLGRGASLVGLTYGTARTRLKCVFQKTGVRRQAELIARLQRELATPLRSP